MKATHCLIKVFKKSPFDVFPNILILRSNNGTNRYKIYNFEAVDKEKGNISNIGISRQQMSSSTVPMVQRCQPTFNIALIQANVSRNGFNIIY